MRHRWGMCFSFVMIINVKKYAYGIVTTCHSDQTCCRLLRSASTTCMLVNKTLVVTLSLRTYSLVFAGMRTHLLIALGVPALTL